MRKFVHSSTLAAHSDMLIGVENKYSRLHLKSTLDSENRLGESNSRQS